MPFLSSPIEMTRLTESVHSANITADCSEPVSLHPLGEVPTVITDVESPSGKDSIAEDHVVTSDMQGNYTVARISSFKTCKSIVCMDGGGVGVDSTPGIFDNVLRPNTYTYNI